MKYPETPAREWLRRERPNRTAIVGTAAEEVFDGFTRLASRLTGCPIALLSILEDERHWFKSAVGVAQGGESRGPGTFCKITLGSDGLFEVEDAQTDARFAEHPLVTGAPHIRHYAGVPLVLADGEVAGTFCVASPVPGRLDALQRAALEELARSAVNVLDLRAREQQLKRDKLLLDATTLSELLPVGVFSTDAAGGVIHGNAHWVRMLGAQRVEDLTGDRWASAIHSEDLNDVRTAWLQAVAARRMYSGVLRTRPDAQGACRWVKFRVSAVDPAMAPIAFVGTTVDVTETVELESQLLQKNRLLRSIFENLPCGLMVFDRDLRVVTGNASASSMLGLPRGLVRADGATLQDLVLHMAEQGEYGAGDVDTNAIVAELMDSVRDGVAHKRERVRPNGQVIEAQTSYMPDGGLITIFQDVTSQRQATEKLMTSESQLTRALAASGLGLWEYDLRDGRIFLSRGWSRLVRLEAQEDTTINPAKVLRLFPPAAQVMLTQERRRLLKGEIDRINIEYQMHTADGELIWVLTEGQVSERTADGRVVKIAGTTKDITKRKRVETELHAALAAADQANRAKSNFLATMSHEIRTPLNGVIGLTQLLRGATLPPMEADSVGMIDSCAKSLLSLVDNILDFSKIEAGRLTLDAVPTDLHQLVGEICDVFSVRSGEKGLRFELARAEQVPRWIVADPGRLRQVLLNLLGNAHKFTAQGGISLEVSVDVADAGRRELAFVVTDSGIGISEADQAKLFTRFTQVDASATRKYQGTGLGLAISRQLAQLMGGDVTLASRVGEGSRFTVRLPLVEAAAPAPVRVAAEQAAPSSARVLLAEDNEVNQLVARRMLKSLGYTQVQVASDGLEAVEAGRTGAFDLVLMDCQMPGMDGLQATRELRRLGIDVPILALTASATSGDRDRCLEAGMDDYLTKPIELPVLGDKLRRWLASGARPRPQEAAPASLPPAFDETILHACFLGDEGLFATSRRIFERTTRQGLAELQEAIGAGDADRVLFVAHRLRGSAATIGAMRLAHCCGLLEQQRKAADALPPLLLAATQAFTDFLAQSEDHAQAEPVTA
jgi:PAS domain S-box-containing protein